MILPSREAGAATDLSPDIATCGDCLRELADPADRRFAYPFINCTNCGPRYSITLRVPYDRPNTTMAPFSLCPDCEREYRDPADRRFHAQPNACAACGPSVTFRGGGDTGAVHGAEAVRAAIALLRDGGVLALKGLGGYQLACNALDAAAVATLRERKRRSNKAFALMAPDVAGVRAFAAVSPEEEALLRLARAADRSARARGRRRPPRRGGPGVGRPRVHAPEHTAALAALLTPAPALRRSRDDQRQRRGRADREGCRNRPPRAGGLCRRLPGPRPRHLHARRRFRRAALSRAYAVHPPGARLRSLGDPPLRVRAAGARVRRRGQEHVHAHHPRRGAREPAHRRSGKPRNPRVLPGDARKPEVGLPSRPDCDRARSAPGLLLDALGARTDRRSNAGEYSTTGRTSLRCLPRRVSPVR